MGPDPQGVEAVAHLRIYAPLCTQRADGDEGKWKLGDLK